MNTTEAPETLGQERSDDLTERFGTLAPLGVPRSRRSIERERDANPGTRTPIWLADKINTSRRAAHPQPCPKCGTDTLVGPDHDTCSLTARVDTTPTDPLTEVIALLAGRESYDLDRGELHHRTPEHHHSARRPHPVLLEHRCADTDPERLF